MAERQGENQSPGVSLCEKVERLQKVRKDLAAAKKNATAELAKEKKKLQRLKKTMSKVNGEDLSYLAELALAKAKAKAKATAKAAPAPAPPASD